MSSSDFFGLNSKQKLLPGEFELIGDFQYDPIRIFGLSRIASEWFGSARNEI